MNDLDNRFRTAEVLLNLSKSISVQDYERVLNNFKSNPNDVFPFTSTELEHCENDELKKFIKRNFGVTKAHVKYKYTDAYENYIYNESKIQDHIKLLTVAYWTLKDVILSNPEMMESELGYKQEDEKRFRKECKLSEEFLYEQSLISLISIFEAYLNDILKWIYQIDGRVQANLRGELSFQQIIDSKKDYDKLLDIIINYNVSNIHSWKKRTEVFNTNPINISFESRSEYKIINEAIARRNCIIHNQGKSNRQYNMQTKSKLSYGTKLKCDWEYFMEVDEAVISLVKYLDNLVESRYSKR